VLFLHAEQILNLERVQFLFHLRKVPFVTPSKHHVTRAGASEFLTDLVNLVDIVAADDGLDAELGQPAGKGRKQFIKVAHLVELIDHQVNLLHLAPVFVDITPNLQRTPYLCEPVCADVCTLALRTREHVELFRPMLRFVCFASLVSACLGFHRHCFCACIGHVEWANVDRESH